MKFRRKDGSFDVDDYVHAVDIVFLAQEILVGFSSYPTEQITRNARAFRQLGLGYTNLGALLMADGLPYDSEPGSRRRRRDHGANDGTRLPDVSAGGGGDGPVRRLRGEPRAPQPGDADASVRLLRDRGRAGRGGRCCTRPASHGIEAVALGEQHGYRNAQATVLAPTGCLVGDSLIATSRGLVRLNHPRRHGWGRKWQDLDIEVAHGRGPEGAQAISTSTGSSRSFRSRPAWRLPHPGHAYASDQSRRRRGRVGLAAISRRSRKGDRGAPG